MVKILMLINYVYLFRCTIADLSSQTLNCRWEICRNMLWCSKNVITNHIFLYDIERSHSGSTGTTNGDARTSRFKLTEGIESLHPYCSRIWWNMHRCTHSAGGFHGSNWLGNWDIACCYNNLSVLRDIWEGKSEWAGVLWLLNRRCLF